ncbi:contact-dependent growth inhibition system immunity protein [Amycolatopsis sp. WGS_07]|uniref:contact-dependent growth inhibition system immunity protein n=1 Tax=Amycolatopsis sp. WGS_07 TaxID=3076764 RepID=UPI003872B2F2
MEDDYWGAPPADATRLMATAYALRRKPIGTLDAEDLRLLLGQQEGVEVLTPLALAQLEAGPLAEGDFCPGDLFEAVLKNPRSYWTEHPDQRTRLQKVIDALAALGDLEEHDAPHDSIWTAIGQFQAEGK